jgi:hypothetical protein
MHKLQENIIKFVFLICALRAHVNISHIIFFNFFTIFKEKNIIKMCYDNKRVKEYNLAVIWELIQTTS